MSAKGVVLKRKIDNAIYDLLPRTLASMVFDSNGKALDEALAELSNVYGNKEEFNQLKTAFDNLTNGAADQFDTLKEIGDWITDHNDAYKALLLAVDKKVDKLVLSSKYFRVDEIPSDYTQEGSTLEVVDDSTSDEDLLETQIKQSTVIGDIPDIGIGENVILCKPANSGVIGNIVTLASDGGINDSGYKAGGASLSEDASDKVIASEKGVSDAIGKSTNIQNCTVDNIPNVDDLSGAELLLAEIM